MSEQLKPCAHCNGEAHLVEDNRHVLSIPANKRLVYYVICKSCWIATRNEYTKEPAVEAWNKRVQDEA